MEFLHFLPLLLTHTKDVLLQLFQLHGHLIYIILFLIIFIETGLVIMPFLPGDSLLFTAGMLCAQQVTGLNLIIIIPLLSAAAILGDNVNYFIGRFFSEHVLKWHFKGKPLVKQEWINDVHQYFEKQGTKTIIIARFIPIVRTVTPFVSGIGEMNYKTFLPFDIIGGVLWITSVTLLGYFLGNVPFVEKNLEGLIIGVVILSILPMIIKLFRRKGVK